MQDIFKARDEIVEDFRSFSQSFTKAKAQDIRNVLSSKDMQEQYWPQPLIQINPHYKTDETVEGLVQKEILHPECARIFKGIRFYKHQAVAITAGTTGHSFVLTSGTGSGKSLAFFVPIIDRILREKKNDAKPRIRALILYPMNALANSQMNEIKKFLDNDPGCGISVKRYTGQEDSSERDALVTNPPDILLTNYMMMELILTRKTNPDPDVVANCAGLEFLVLDELHTYRGRQGADVAMLVRRIRLATNSPDLVCIGTSATMSSGGSELEQQQAVADVTSVLFGTTIKASDVIMEQLDRVTEGNWNPDILRSELEGGAAWPDDYEGLRHDELAKWVEMNISIVLQEGTSPKRATPRTIKEISAKLAKDAAVSEKTALCSLQGFLNHCEKVRNEEDEPLFAFKLHQFLSGPGFLLTTLEEEGKRVVTLDEQQFAPGRESKGVRLYRTYFCRNCGREFIPVWHLSGDIESFVPRDINETSLQEDGLDFGYLVPKLTDMQYDGQPETLPDSWLEYGKDDQLKVKSSYKKNVPVPVNLSPDGSVDPFGNAYWYFKGSARFCPDCLHEFDIGANEKNKLVGLSGEGRSSATSVLTFELLSFMFGENGLSKDKDNRNKILGFTDNRQDAALQSGNFNDFVYLVTVRSALLAALEVNEDSELETKDLGEAVFSVLGFKKYDDLETLSEYLNDPDVPGSKRIRSETAAKGILTYRMLHDLERTWRYTNPNLQATKLVEIVFPDVAEMVLDERRIHGKVHLEAMTPVIRKELFNWLFRFMVESFCIDSYYLNPTNLSAWKGDCGNVKEKWCFENGEKLYYGNRLIVGLSTAGSLKQKDAFRYVGCGPTSKVIRELKRSHYWAGTQWAMHSGKVATQDASELLEEMLALAVSYELVSSILIGGKDTKKCWAIKDIGYRWKLTKEGMSERTTYNEFYATLYKSVAHQFVAQNRKVFGFESKEHTAQVSSEDREVLEARFRDGTLDRQEWKEKTGMDLVPLPVLYCSPTMELGIDISTLDTVYLRNVPPTPANYAQRSGRAGRSGSAALVLSYCAFQSPHDQWFFAHQDKMVHGAVGAPTLDLSNRDLIDSHLLALWLSVIDCPLGSSVPDVLDLEKEKENFPVKEEITQRMNDPATLVKAKTVMRKMGDLLRKTYLTQKTAPWFTPSYTDDLAEEAYGRFDKAFDTWRNLFKSTQRQLNHAAAMSASAQTSNAMRTAFQQIYIDASRQLNLLQQKTGSMNSPTADFYLFRYLAEQGVLPGYNFPRLPLIAWIPADKSSMDAGRNGIDATTLSRSRFLALSEFGPGSLIYHQGKVFKVDRLKLNASSANASSTGFIELGTQEIIICPHCGYGILYDSSTRPLTDRCPNCNEVIDGSGLIKGLYRVDTVETRQVERITANDEERRRQGYEMQVSYRFDSDAQTNEKKKVVDDNGTCLAHLQYNAGAKLYKINRGWRRRTDKNVIGYLIDPQTGRWQKEKAEIPSSDDDDEDGPGRSKVVPQRIVPFVEDRKNMLLFKPEIPPDADRTEVLVTLATALKRGIEHTFEVEESELAAEPIPNADDRRLVLFYEASEGGAGILSRLTADDGTAIRQVAMKALEIMHYEVDQKEWKVKNVDDTCEHGCYRCLLSYYNQTEHQYINRRNQTVIDILLALARGKMVEEKKPAEENIDELSKRFLEVLNERGGKAKSFTPYPMKDGSVIPLLDKLDKVCVYFGNIDPATKSNLESKCFTVIDAGAEPECWENIMTKYSREFGIGENK